MKQDIAEYLETGKKGIIVRYEIKSDLEWIAIAKEAMAEAEKYGATKVSEMREAEREKLFEALDALNLRIRHIDLSKCNRHESEE